MNGAPDGFLFKTANDANSRDPAIFEVHKCVGVNAGTLSEDSTTFTGGDCSKVYWSVELTTFRWAETETFSLSGKQIFFLLRLPFVYWKILRKKKT